VEAASRSPEPNGEMASQRKRLLIASGMERVYNNPIERLPVPVERNHEETTADECRHSRL
jgi:hypothetical protein